MFKPFLEYIANLSQSLRNIRPRGSRENLGEGINKLILSPSVVYEVCLEEVQHNDCASSTSEKNEGN